MLQPNKWITEEIKKKKISIGKWKWKHNDPKTFGMQQSYSQREVYNNTILPQKIREISNKQSNLIQKATREITNKTHS